MATNKGRSFRQFFQSFQSFWMQYHLLRIFHEYQFHSVFKDGFLSFAFSFPHRGTSHIVELCFNGRVIFLCGDQAAVSWHWWPVLIIVHTKWSIFHISTNDTAKHMSLPSFSKLYLTKPGWHYVDIFHQGPGQSGYKARLPGLAQKQSQSSWPRPYFELEWIQPDLQMFHA